MDEKLNRKELPIQSVYQRNQDVTVTVPVHLAVMNLSPRIRTYLSLIADAKDPVKQWYEEDMAYYLDVLKQYETELPWFKEYERFRDEWQLNGEPDNNGFLSLSWRENGTAHTVKFNPVPVILCNQHDEFGEFYTPESLTKGGSLIEIIYRSIRDPEIVTMSPDKMRSYGRETDIARIDRDKGIAEVVGHAFTSDYHDNMAKALLLRNFTVFYLNQLLARTNTNQQI